jgi:hypothetical protein
MAPEQAEPLTVGEQRKKRVRSFPTVTSPVIYTNSSL